MRKRHYFTSWWFSYGFKWFVQKHNFKKKELAWGSTPNLQYLSQQIAMKVCYLSPFINSCFVK